MLIPILYCDPSVQVFDLIRFDATKSLAVRGTVDQINSVKIQCGIGGGDIDVFHTLSKNWFLDFVFNSEDSFDFDASNGEIHFLMNGVTYSTLVSAGEYTLANLLIEIKTKMEAVASPLSVSFVVDSRNRITLTPSIPLQVLPNHNAKGLWKSLGFSKDGQLVSDPVEFGFKKITLTVESNSESAQVVKWVKVYTKYGDALFSEDGDIVIHEPDIMKWLPQGYSTFNHLHRAAQESILDWCDRQGYRDSSGLKLNKWAFVDKSDVRTWSMYIALKYFCLSVRNQETDVWLKKSNEYEKLEISARTRAVLSLDLDKDTKPDTPRGPDINTGRLLFR